MTLYSSREPFNDDPTPWVSTAPDFERYENEHDYEGRHGVLRDPRPEYDRPQNNPTNRLLQGARRAQADGFLSDFLEGFLEYRNTKHAEIDHAQRVLTRLANFQKEESLD